MLGLFALGAMSLVWMGLVTVVILARRRSPAERFSREALR
jgi:predicted metal-binding membrane protein